MKLPWQKSPATRLTTAEVIELFDHMGKVAPLKKTGTRRANRRPEPPASFRPWPCVVLAIDAGAVSGWAILHACNYLNSGECKKTRDKMDVVARALEYARTVDEPLVVVSECWAGAFQSHQTPIALGAEWGEWKTILNLNDIPKQRRVRVYPRTWQAATVGGRQQKRKLQIAAVQSWIQYRFSLPVLPRPNEAAALGIACWGSFAGRVGAALEWKPPKKGYYL